MQRNGTPLKYPAIPKSWTEEMGKGGARRTTIPETSFDAMFEILDLQIHDMGIKRGLFFHMYDRISRSQAADARGLAANHGMLMGILRIAPAGEVPASIITRALKQLVHKWPGLNNGPYPDDLFAGSKADQITTMLYHLRRVKNDSKKEQELRNKASAEDMVLVSELIGMICCRSSGTGAADSQSVAASTKAYPEDQDLPNDSQQLDDEPSPPSPAKVRKLKIEVSLDGDGYPKMLSSIEPHPIVSEFAIPVPEVATPDVSMGDWAIDDHLLLEAVMCKNFEALLKQNYVLHKNKTSANKLQL